ncbi:Sec-independent protein translocase protein TatB [Marinobacter subterrani]|uniref:Sec-independent protein translocase protein TatB n=1 Tax=Marinobacter subterrani TaxID=1658765 RepID=A0A0J7JFC8_9GAMM|nr:Sec-independent protein translocase protein TatB [Marinobacter subterrani]KMQ76486.1 twin arginine-targeting protein translocase TatB [Marinobacter subterrani]
MFDIGFLELLVCGVIALLVLGPERLPTAARAAGRWVAGARRMVSQFTSELDRQLKADELREELRKAGDVGLDDVQKTVRGALDEARKYEHMVLPENESTKSRSAPATRRVAASPKAGAPDGSAPPDSGSASAAGPAGSGEASSASGAGETHTTEQPDTPQSPPDKSS